MENIFYEDEKHLKIFLGIKNLEDLKPNVYILKHLRKENNLLTDILLRIGLLDKGEFIDGLVRILPEDFPDNKQKLFCFDLSYLGIDLLALSKKDFSVKKGDYSFSFYSPYSKEYPEQ